MSITVNGTEISDQSIEGVFNQMQQQYSRGQQGQGPAEEELRAWARESVIDQTLLRQEAEKDETPVTVDELHEFYRSANDNMRSTPFETAKQEIASRIRVKRVVQAAGAKMARIDEAEARRFFDENPQHFEVPEQIHAAHIVKHAKTPDEMKAAREAIEEVQKALKEGAEFEDLAASQSDCGDDNGDLGTFPRGKMVEQFDQVAFALEPGQISEPVESPFGCHLIKVYERVAPAKRGFEEVSDSIREFLAKNGRQEAITAHLQQLRAAATIVEG